MAGFDVGGLPRDQGEYGTSFRYNADDEWEEIGPFRLDAQTEIMKTEMKAQNMRVNALIVILAIIGAALTIVISFK